MKSALSSPPRLNRTRHGILTRKEWFLLGTLVLLPLCAVVRLSFTMPPLKLAAWALGVSLAAYAACSWDKSRARRGAWRLSESSLHLLEALGGWPGSFIAQRIHRHKTAKSSYQMIFAFIIALHQLAAVDILAGGRLLRLLKSLVF